VPVEYGRYPPTPEEWIMARVTPVSTAEFGREVLFSPIPVVVDFYADWCGPCRLLAPVLEQYAATFDGVVKFAKVDVDVEPDLTSHFDVSSVPTLLFFRDGQLADRLAGIPTAVVMRAKLDALTRQPTVRHG
jgi:thioredoxin 1